MKSIKLISFASVFIFNLSAIAQGFQKTEVDLLIQEPQSCTQIAEGYRGTTTGDGQSGYQHNLRKCIREQFAKYKDAYVSKCRMAKDADRQRLKEMMLGETRYCKDSYADKNTPSHLLFGSDNNEQKECLKRSMRWAQEVTERVIWGRSCPLEAHKKFKLNSKTPAGYEPAEPNDQDPR